MEPIAPQSAAAPAVALCFTLSAADFAELPQHPLLAGATPPPHARSHIETWYDTPDLALLRHGFELSLTRARHGHAQTLRHGGTCVTTQLTEALPDPAAFGPGWAEPLAGLLTGAPLTPAFATQTKHLTRHAGPVALRFESGFIQTSTEKLPIREMVLTGPPADLYQLALALAERHALILQPASLVQRGIWATGAMRPAAVKAGPGLTGSICLNDAIAALTQSCLTQFTANWPVFALGTETEAVHQMRVAMRRLRSALGLFNRAFATPDFAAFRDEAKRIAGIMGEARNWDVFTALLQTGPAAAFPHEPGFAPLFKQCAALRATGYAAVRALLADPATSTFLLSLELFLTRHGWRNGLAADGLASLGAPAQDFAAGNLTRLHRKLRKHGRHLARAGMAEKHRARIELKKLRYTAELFGGLFEGRGKIRGYTRAAAALQEELGLLNDLATAQTLLARLNGSPPALARAIGIAHGWCAHAANADTKELHRLWKHFMESKPFPH